jgi:hypothetical protein
MYSIFTYGVVVCGDFAVRAASDVRGLVVGVVVDCDAGDCNVEMYIIISHSLYPHLCTTATSESTQQ